MLEVLGVTNEYLDLNGRSTSDDPETFNLETMRILYIVPILMSMSYSSAREPFQTITLLLIEHILYRVLLVFFLDYPFHLSKSLARMSFL